MVKTDALESRVVCYTVAVLATLLEQINESEADYIRGIFDPFRPEL